jgi:uncharacterized protein (UPF0335 family)
MKAEKKKRRVQAGPVVAGALKSFVERIERVETEEKASADGKREIYKEAKGQGYDTKTIRWIVKERKVEESDRAERDALRDTYAYALGLAVDAVSNGDMSLRQAAAAHGVSKSSIHRALSVPEVSREMVADDIGQWLPPHNTIPDNSKGRPRPGRILPTAAAWQAVIAAREAHHARIEAEREARRLKRQQENERAARLAMLTDADMPDQPEFLRRRVA